MNNRTRRVVRAAKSVRIGMAVLGLALSRTGCVRQEPIGTAPPVAVQANIGTRAKPALTIDGLGEAVLDLVPEVLSV